MPYLFHIDSEQRLIYKRVWGDYDDEQSVAAVEEFRGFPEHLVFNELHDLRKVTRYEVSMEWVKNLAIDTTRKDLEQDYPSKKVAYVATDPAAYGTGRALEVLQSDSHEEFKVFDDLADACEWLDVDPGQLSTGD